MFVLIAFAATGRAFAQIPAEWQSAAQVVIGRASCRERVYGLV